MVLCKKNKGIQFKKKNFQKQFRLRNRFACNIINVYFLHLQFKVILFLLY